MIYIPKVCGSCRGVTKLLKTVYEVYEREIVKENPRRIVIFGNIISDALVDKELENLGIIKTNEIDNIDYDDIVIIPSHGIDKDIIEYLKDNDIEFYDATCLKISKVYKNVLEKYKNGYEIIIIGDSNSEEVKNILSWCDNKGIILNTIVDVVNMKYNDLPKLVVVESSFKEQQYLEIIKTLQEKYLNIELIIENSLCKSVNNIIKSSMDIAKKSDLLFIVGNKEDSYTLELFNNLKEITEIEVIDNINDFLLYIMNNDINSLKNIGITGSINIPIKELYNYKYLLNFILFYKEVIKEYRVLQSEVNNNLIEENSNDNLKEVINDFCDLNSSGKNLRATIIALGYYLACGQKTNDYLSLAASYEMLETSLLVHDDIIDNAKIRRGKETIPRRVCEKYLKRNKDINYQNSVLVLANSLGICAGDYGFFESIKLLSKSYGDKECFSSLINYFTEIIVETIKGEMLDVILPFKSRYDDYLLKEEDVLEVYHLKTALYTITGPFNLGYILGAKEKNKDIEEILNLIGISYQIKDDILGIFGNVDKTCTDIEEFKQTILYSYIINTNYKNEFLNIYGKKNINSNDIKKIENLLQTSGALEYATNYLNNLNYEINEKLDKIDIDNEVKDILKGLSIYINIRIK